MADTGLLNPGTTADDATVGTKAWTNTANVVSSNDVYATCDLSTTVDFFVDDNSIRLYSGGAFVGDNKASATNWSDPTDAVRTYGGATDKWGLTPTESDVENSGWGVGISCQKDASTPESHYLLATNFGVSISSSSIDGIEVKVECHSETSLSISFIGGTLISTPNGDVEIQKIKVGDYVYGFTKSGKVGIGRVTKTKKGVSKKTIRIVADDSIVIATPRHRFLVGTNKFVEAGRLKKFDTVFLRNGKILRPVTIEDIREKVLDVEVYSLEVSGLHTFFANSYAVHNGIIAGSTTASIDHIQMKIYYTASTTQVFLIT